MKTFEQYKNEVAKEFGHLDWNGVLGDEDSRPLALLNEAGARLEKDVNSLAKFKSYVHQRLDKMDIPTDPEPEKNKKTGCRIEGRLNFIEAKLSLLATKENKWDHPGISDGDL